jgi:U3 small nucleolar RNA-associated protein 4
MVRKKRKRESGAGDEKGVVREGLGNVKTFETVMGKQGGVVRQEVQRLDGIDEDDETRELEDEADLDLDTTNELRETRGKGRKKKDEPWWFTFRFRPILGVVSLHDGEPAREIEEKIDAAMEVVLVERPVWDLDLPPRFASSHER